MYYYIYICIIIYTYTYIYIIYININININYTYKYTNFKNSFRNKHESKCVIKKSGPFLDLEGMYAF